MTATEPGQRYPLAAAFTATGVAASGDLPTSEIGLARLEAQLQRLWSSAHDVWPDLDVPAERYAAHLGQITGGASDRAAVLGELATSDLYLACAAMQGSDQALTMFEGHTFGEIHAAGAALRASDTDVEEVKQVIRTQLFVSDDERQAAIADYAGRGSLRGWVRVIATRELLRMRRRSKKEVPLEETILRDLESQPDPEIAHLKDVYRYQVASALREALERLEVRERLLLRYHVCDHLSIDEIGAIYQVHRATAARWLSRARSALVNLTTEQLAILLSVEPAEADSIIRLVHSQLDVSLERRLRDDP
jgi:RNA polymerase sigma-70 factor, ECF subfamily